MQYAVRLVLSGDTVAALLAEDPGSGWMKWHPSFFEWHGLLNPQGQLPELCPHPPLPACSL